jgi:hypothetical protein
MDQVREDVRRSRAKRTVRRSAQRPGRPRLADRVEVVCPGCDRLIKSTRDLLGRQVRCPSCRRAFQVSGQAQGIKARPSSAAERGSTGLPPYSFEAGVLAAGLLLVLGFALFGGGDDARASPPALDSLNGPTFAEDDHHADEARARRARARVEVASTSRDAESAGAEAGSPEDVDVDSRQAIYADDLPRDPDATTLADVDPGTNEFPTCGEAMRAGLLDGVTYSNPALGLVLDLPEGEWSPRCLALGEEAEIEITRPMIELHHRESGLLAIYCIAPGLSDTVATIADRQSKWLRAPHRTGGKPVTATPVEPTRFAGLEAARYRQTLKLFEGLELVREDVFVEVRGLIVVFSWTAPRDQAGFHAPPWPKVEQALQLDRRLVAGERVVPRTAEGMAMWAQTSSRRVGADYVNEAAGLRLRIPPGARASTKVVEIAGTWALKVAFEDGLEEVMLLLVCDQLGAHPMYMMQSVLPAELQVQRTRVQGLPAALAFDDASYGFAVRRGGWTVILAGEAPHPQQALKARAVRLD